MAEKSRHLLRRCYRRHTLRESRDSTPVGKSHQGDGAALSFVRANPRGQADECRTLLGSRWLAYDTIFQLSHAIKIARSRVLASLPLQYRAPK